MHAFNYLVLVLLQTLILIFFCLLKTHSHVQQSNLPLILYRQMYVKVFCLARSKRYKGSVFKMFNVHAVCHCSKRCIHTPNFKQTCKSATLLICSTFLNSTICSYCDENHALEYRKYLHSTVRDDILPFYSFMILCYKRELYSFIYVLMLKLIYDAAIIFLDVDSCQGWFWARNNALKISVTICNFLGKYM